jgi:hypothetical protein
MAVWLVRAIMAENVTARRDHATLKLPAGRNFRLEKEIKNVITAVAKTCHYWDYHRPAEQFDPPHNLLEPALPADANDNLAAYQAVEQEIIQGIMNTTDLLATKGPYLGWVSVACADQRMAAWMMRAMAVENVVVRREDDRLFVPVNMEFTSQQRAVIVAALGNAYRLLGAREAARMRSV